MRARSATIYNGDLIAGGLFTSADGVQVNGITRWDGSSWQPMGNGVGNVNELTVFEGQLIAAGIGPFVRKWDGNTWQPFGNQIEIYAFALHNGGLFAAARSPPPNPWCQGPGSCSNIFRLVGSTWEPLVAIGTTGPAPIGALTSFDGELVVGGAFMTAGGNASPRFALISGLVCGDVTGDGVVNVSDLLAVINAWGACPAPPALCPADVTGDGQVNVSDLLMVINNWG